MVDPTSQPDREEQIRQITAYLEQHRAQYDLRALRKQLLDAGYPNATVDEALRRLDGGRPSATGAGIPLIAIGLSLLNQIPVAFVGYLFVVLTNNILFFLIGIPIVLGVELMIYAWLRNSPGRARASQLLRWTMIWTLVVDLVFAGIAALLVGICVALLSGI